MSRAFFEEVKYKGGFKAYGHKIPEKALGEFY